MSCRIWFKQDEYGNLVFIDEEHVPLKAFNEIAVIDYIKRDYESLVAGQSVDQAYSKYYNYCLEHNQEIATLLEFQEILMRYCESPIIKLKKEFQ